MKNEKAHIQSLCCSHSPLEPYTMYLYLYLFSVGKPEYNLFGLLISYEVNVEALIKEDLYLQILYQYIFLTPNVQN